MHEESQTIQKYFGASKAKGHGEDCKKIVYGSICQVKIM
jgi:hypothetical protein